MIVGLSGLAGSGKDAVADFLSSQRGFCKIALADPMKRFVKEMFDWDEQRLWGASALRNAIDDTRKRPDGQYLTARHALQQLGTQWGRACYEDVWVEYAVRAAKKRLETFSTSRVDGVVIPDVRFTNELRAIRKAGGEVWRIVRPGAGLQGEAARHASERGIEDGDCDRILLNRGTLEDLADIVKNIQIGDRYCGAV